MLDRDLPYRARQPLGTRTETGPVTRALEGVSRREVQGLGRLAALRPIDGSGIEQEAGLVPSLCIADTNTYAGAANDAALLERFQGFVRQHGALFVSTVVVAEVVVGISDAARRAEAANAVASGTRLAAPTRDARVKAGEVTAKFGREEFTTHRCFLNDALLAAQCSRLGAARIIRNNGGFSAFGGVQGWRWWGRFRIRRASKVAEAAGVIHGDFQCGSIRAESSSDAEPVRAPSRKPLLRRSGPTYNRLPIPARSKPHTASEE